MTGHWRKKEENHEHEDNNTNNGMQAYHFPTIISQIQNVIHKLRGEGIFPKFNWSSPKDALWWDIEILMTLEFVALI